MGLFTKFSDSRKSKNIEVLMPHSKEDLELGLTHYQLLIKGINLMATLGDQVTAIQTELDAVKALIAAIPTTLTSGCN